MTFGRFAQLPPRRTIARTERREATAVAAGILSRRVEHGDRIAIMLPTQRSYFTIFVGVLLAGCTPVPIYPPPSMATLGEHLARQSRLLRNAGTTMLVTVPEARLAARLVRAQVPSLRSVLTPEELMGLAGSAAERGTLPAARADDIALIHYTSGSTGDPKGVVLTHAQLLSNIRSMGEAAQVTTSDVFVSIDRIPDSELETLDLSSWRLSFSGSEQVSAATVGDFERRFAPRGFRHETM